MAEYKTPATMKWLQWAQQIQSISQAGLTYAKDPFDKGRYEELLQLSAEIIEQHSEHEMQSVLQLYTQEKGYQTPKVDVRGVVFHEGQILLVKERSDGRWTLPGGYCDIGYSPKENVVKELYEESGYETVPVRLLAVLDKFKHPHPAEIFQYYKLFIECEIVGGNPSTSMETSDVQFFSRHELPPLSLGRVTPSQVDLLFQYENAPNLATWID
ncbi:ADP-ribose pyrophosphatase [Pontibacillus halophilus JSM 076056 = DSM 19796]|uniref:ADP-ribose pyrophosphatase n=1 Tax=Pontibacillus halophilus JSM 076056 = DSM 19796 TaxID=1385510 RepID=A0A0A5GLK7_9BACI|nr:NUDIX hydrolase [Pontibacillus halophilus]KGX92108.1 ADP-ribose pyrophosphatase [Pontibacillus halophilus JSM 076056 = DSM 19796]